jgi:hypothetical protein
VTALHAVTSGPEVGRATGIPTVLFLHGLIVRTDVLRVETIV